MSNDKENVSDILSELNKVLSGLTDDQRQKIEGEFNAPPETKAQPQTQPQAQLKQEVQPQSAPTPQPQAQVPSAPQPASPPPVQKSQQEMQPEAFKAINLSSPSTPEPADVPPGAIPSQITPPPVSETAAPPEAQTPPVDQEVPLIQPAASYLTPPTPSPVMEEEDEPIPSEQMFKLACFYQEGKKELADVFFEKLSDVLQKTTKKEYFLDKVIAEEMSFAAFDFKQIVERCKSSGVDAVFFISPDKLDIVSDGGLYYGNITTDKVDKRFLYVDFAVELMLIKKSSKGNE